MNKWIVPALLAVGALSQPASADILGATAGFDYWYADAKLNDVRADDSQFQPSVFVAFEHFIPLIPNAKIRYTGIEATKFNTDFDQYDLIAYYELLDNSLLSLDVGANIQHFTGTFRGADIKEWQPNLYANGAIGIPGLPVSLFATFSVGEFDNTSTVDAEAGAIFSIDLVAASVDFKLGYRIIDNDFAYFVTPAKFTNDGFFLGVQVDI